MSVKTYFDHTTVGTWIALRKNASLVLPFLSWWSDVWVNWWHSNAHLKNEKTMWPCDCKARIVFIKHEIHCEIGKNYGNTRSLNAKTTRESEALFSIPINTLLKVCSIYSEFVRDMWQYRHHWQVCKTPKKSDFLTPSERLLM